jgi:hypothetical protein
LLFAGFFEDLLDCVFCFVGVEALEAGGHGGTSSLHPTLRKMREGWGTRAFWVV